MRNISERGMSKWTQECMNDAWERNGWMNEWMKEGNNE